MSTAAAIVPPVAVPPPADPIAPALGADGKPVVPPAADPPKPPEVKVADPRASAEKLRVLQERQALDADRAKHAEAQKALDAAQKALDAEKAKTAEDVKLAAAVKDALKSKNPAKALTTMGFTADEVAAFLVDGADTPVDPKVAALEKRLDDLTKAADARTAKERTAEERAARADVLATIAESKDALPWVNALGQGEQVIAEMLKEHGKSGLMDVEAASKAVELRLAAEMPATLDKLLAVPVVRAAIEAAVAKATKAAVPATPAAKADEKKPPADVPPKKNWTAKVERGADKKVEAVKRPDETFPQFLARKEKERQAAKGGAAS